MQKRLLIFSPFFAPSNFPEAIVTGKLALAMRERAWITVVVASPTPADANDDCKIWEPLRGCVHYTRLHRGSAKRLLDRAREIFEFGHVVQGIGWARQALRIGRELAKRHRYDAMMSRTRPVYANLPAMALRRETGIPWIASWNDPPNRDPIPYGPGPDGKVSFWEDRAVRQAASRADCNLFCSERLRRYCSAIYPRMADRSEVIPHLGFPSPMPIDSDPDQFSILHIGSLDGARDPRVFFEGLDKFLETRTADERSKVLVRFIGAHRIDLELRRLATPRVNAVMRVEPWCSYEESLRCMGMASVLLMIEAPMSEGVLLLAKLADYAVSGRPILAVSPRVGTAADVLGEYGGGVAADNRDASSVAAALDSLFVSWRAKRLETDFPKNKIRPRFSSEWIVDDFEKLIARIQPDFNAASSLNAHGALETVR